MKIDWGKHYPTLSVQLKKQGHFCDNLVLRKLETNRERSNALYESGLIDAVVLEAIRLKLTDEISRMAR